MPAKLQLYLVYVFRTAVFCYAAFAIFYFLKRPVGSGDEALFIGDLRFIDAEGWFAAIKKGISIPYMLLAYPLHQFLEPHLALRGVNVLLILVMVGYFYKIRNIRQTDFYLLLLFFYSTVGYFLYGINDTLFIVSMVIFFSETYFIISSEKQENIALLGTALIVAVFTRALFLVFLPVVLFSVFLLIKQKKISMRSLLGPGLLCIVFLVMNIPSLQENHKLSYDSKEPPATAQANWAQRQYYAQMLVNVGKLDNFNHPTWKQTDAYLAQNGKDALPDGILSGLTFDLGTTVKEFFKDFYYITFYSIRQLGLVVLIVLFFGMREFFKKRKITPQNYVSVVLLTTMLIFSLIIISFVELRWLGAVFIMAILCYSLFDLKKNIPLLIINLNYVVIILICLYGMYGFFQKIV